MLRGYIAGDALVEQRARNDQPNRQVPPLRGPDKI